MELGAAAAASTAGVGMGLFSYNRGNYMFDQKMHYTRFTAGLNMAIAQTGLYKQDIAQLTTLTVTRQDCYHGISAMGLTILTAIYCPGRVGLHTPPPPGWLMGLMFLNIAGTYLFLGLSLWMAMHASMRADTASTHMLTRFVRLPIPSQAMLDKARKFLSSYEEQPLKEVFRIPFTRHQKAGAKKGTYNDDMVIEDEAQGRSRRGVDVPAWYRKEKQVDSADTCDTLESMMPLGARGNAPEHFEAYRRIQMEWFPFDVYARLGIFLAFMHMMQCWSYQQIGHQFQELRQPWACAIVLLPTFVLQQVILTLDVIPCTIPAHRVGPFGLLFAYIASFIEYRRWFSPEWQAFGFFCVYLAYACHIIFVLSMLKLCAPAAEAPEVAESPGASWWPGEWRLPTAFQHAIWLVAPPRDLPAGQVDVVGELRDAQRGGAGPASAAGDSGDPTDAEKRADVHRALGRQGESPAWCSIRVGLVAMLIGWIWLVIGFTIEIINQGTDHPSLLNAPGMPNNLRDPRYRPAKPGAHEPVEVGTGGVHGPAKGVHGGSMHRRLAASLEDPNLLTEDFATKLRVLVPYLEEVVQAGFAPAASVPSLASLAPAALAASSDRHVAVSWPPMFEPEVLTYHAASGHHLVLSRYGRGLAVDASDPGSDPRPFVLAGVAEHGRLMSASAHADGPLVVATSSGAVLECKQGGSQAVDWGCQVLPGRLPLGDGNPKGLRVAVTSEGANGLRAVVAYPGEDTAVVLAPQGAGHDDSWSPVSEARIPAGTEAMSYGPGGGELLLLGADGAVVRLDMAGGVLSGAVGAAAEGGLASGERSWQALCTTRGIANAGSAVSRLSRGAQRNWQLVLA